MSYRQGLEIISYLGTLVWLWEFTLALAGSIFVVYVILFPIFGLFRYR